MRTGSDGRSLGGPRPAYPGTLGHVDDPKPEQTQGELVTGEAKEEVGSWCGTDQNLTAPGLRLGRIAAY